MSVLGFNIVPFPLWDNKPLCDEVPIGVAISANFLGIDEYTLNLQQQIQQQRINAVRGCYFDNSRNNTDVLMTALNTGMTILFPARTQGFMPLFLNNDSEMSLSTVAGTGLFKMTLTNFIIHPQIWSATI